MSYFYRALFVFVAAHWIFGIAALIGEPRPKEPVTDGDALFVLAMLGIHFFIAFMAGRESKVKP